MKESTPECRKDCDIYEAWKKSEADNAGLALDNMRMIAAIAIAREFLREEGDCVERSMRKEFEQALKGE